MPQACASTATSPNDSEYDGTTHRSAARVGGLPTAVAEGRSGRLVDGHDPRVWACALADALADPETLERWSLGAVEHAAHFGWEATADATLDVYRGALAERAGGRPLAAVRA